MKNRSILAFANQAAEIELQDLTRDRRTSVTQLHLLQQNENSLAKVLKLEKEKVAMLQKEIAEISEEKRAMAAKLRSSDAEVSSEVKPFERSRKAVSVDISIDQKVSRLSSSGFPSNLSPTLKGLGSDSKSFQEEIKSREDEISLLNREITFLNRELKEKAKDTSQIILRFEKTLKQEKDLSENMIRRLKENLENKDKEIERILGKEIVDDEFSLKRRADALKTLKVGLENAFLERREITQKLDYQTKLSQSLQENLKQAENQISNLQKQICELERINETLTKKYLQAASSESEALEKFEKLKVRLRRYEKFLADIQVDKTKILQ